MSESLGYRRPAVGFSARRSWIVAASSLLLALEFSCSSGERSSADNTPTAGAPSAGKSGAAGTAGTRAAGGSTSGGQSGTAGSAGSLGNGGAAGAGTAGAGGTTSSQHEKRIIGYLPDWNGSYADWADVLDFSALTHLNLAFGNPGSGNNVIAIDGTDSEIAALIGAAHAKGVKVLISLGGGSGSSGFADHYSPANVDALVAGIADFVSAHGLDGADVDVEAPGNMGQNYGTFVQKLEAALKPQSKLLTAAVARWIQDAMPDDALARFDFVNVMSYDECGSWTEPCEHSSYDQAVSDLDYYSVEKQLAPDKIVLGVPFYGYCWGSCESDYVLYKDILLTHADAWQGDWIDQGGAQWSYNGEATMAKKADLARDYGGVMIWELSGDASGQRSLLAILSSKL
ncbi:MAG TPA: glycosyl hydrolase family 18 protein [Polyangiaceae bacterium]|nr:glycosyl hydrolase family 18 protein [Polyangiaceae bacterium]